MTLPGLAGLRVLGGVRVAASGGTLDSPGPPRSDWRAFLDVPAQPQVMTALLGHLEAQGWQTAQMFQETFVEANRSQWLGVMEKPPRALNLRSGQQDDVTQVWLTASDKAPGQAEQLLGRSLHPYFHDTSTTISRRRSPR